MREMRLYDHVGNWLRLNTEEIADFFAAARKRPARDRTLCETLHYTVCRPGELIEITPARIDLSGGGVTLRTLKKRRDDAGSPRIVCRAGPVPPEYMDIMNTAHGIREAQRTKNLSQGLRCKEPQWLNFAPAVTPGSSCRPAPLQASPGT